jgi:serine protease Do
MATHYQVLGLAPDAPSVDIAAAYREKREALGAKGLATPENLQRLKEAYTVLADPVRRQEYDQKILPRRAKPAPVDDTHEASGMPAWLKFGVPAVLVAVSYFGWRAAHKPKAPTEPIMVSRTDIDLSQMPTAPDQAGREATQPTGTAVMPAAPVTQSAAAVFQSASQSIVRILAGDDTGPTSQGSGVVIGRGVVITNCHVVEGASQIRVKTGPSNWPATVSLADGEQDLCRLDVSGLDAPAVTIAGVGDLKTGERVYAIGAPYGYELTISEGIVSSLRPVTNGKIIQTTAAVSPGSSGGGLFDSQARLVGIVTFQRKDGQNLNFALPADWISSMRPSGAIRSARARDPESISDMVVGNWYCFGSLSGRNGEYNYGSDGILRFSLSDGGQKYAVRYLVANRTISYSGADGKGILLEIESIEANRMVQVVGDGQRLACDRR